MCLCVQNVPTNAVDHLDLLPEEKPKNRYRNVLPSKEPELCMLWAHTRSGKIGRDCNVM